MSRGAPSGAARVHEDPARSRSADPHGATLGPRGDAFEREADAMADRVVAGERSVASAHGSLLRFPVSPAGAPPGDRPGSRGLEEPLRSRMERGFGADFGGVGVHTGSSAAAESRCLGARAFTVGTDIWFGRGEYRPATPSGQRLIAHELAHTLQPGRERVVRRSPVGEEVEQVVIDIGTAEVLVITNRSRYKYPLNKGETKNLPPGTYEWRHTKGAAIDEKKGGSADVILKNPPEAVGKQIHWEFESVEHQPKWSEFEDSTFQMIVLDSANLQAGSGKGAGTGKGKKGAGKGEKKGAGEKKGDGQGGGGKKPATDEQKKARVDRFLAKFKEEGKGGGEKLTREKLEELVGEWSDAEIDEFFDLFEQAQSQHPLKSIEEILEWYGKLTPSQKEVLRVNKTLGESLEEGAPGELPEDIQLMITTEAGEATDLTEKITDTNKSLEAIRRKVHEIDPERAKDFEPLDPQKLTAFNEMMALEALLAGASERSPEIAGIAKSLTGNIGKIRDYILEELAWLAGEIAATTLLSILAAPVSGGASAAVGATRAAMLVVRLNRLRKLLDAIQSVRAVADTLERIEEIYDKVQKVSEHAEKLKAYREKLDRLIELRKRVASASEDVGEKYHDDLDALEDEVLEMVRGLIEAEGGLGDILDFLYLPEGADEEEIRRIILDLPRGLDAAQDMFAYYERMQSGDLEATKVLMFKAYAAGYLLYPLVGYIADMANEELNALMRDKSLDERLMGMLSKGRSGGRKGKGPDNRRRIREVRKKKDKRKAEDERRKKEKKEREKEEKAGAAKKEPDDKKKKKDDEEDDEKLSKEDKAWRKLGRALRDVPKDFDEGGTQEDVLRAVRKLTAKTKYRKVAGGVSATTLSDKPAYWQITVQRSPRGTPHTVLVLKTERTRYIAIRKAIKKEFEQISDGDRKREAIEKKVGELKGAYVFPDVRVRDKTDEAGATVIGWEIQGKLGKSWQEILTIDSAEHAWGSETQPIPIDWPKPEIDDYPSLFVGPPVRKSVKLVQKDLEALRGEPQPDREAFADAHASPANQKDIDAWKAAGAEVKEYTPTKREKLPSPPSKTTIGVTNAYQVRPKFKFRLDPQGTTPGGEKILGPLRMFGYSAQNEGTAGDHVVEYALGGDDETVNLWPLNASMNSSSGGTLKSMSFPRPGTNQMVTMAQLKARAKKSGKKNEVWFRINSVRPAP